MYKQNLYKILPDHIKPKILKRMNRYKKWEYGYNIDHDISADRLKNAAATKKLAIFDCFEILNRIEEEKNMLEEKPKEVKKETTFRGFAEGRSK